MQIDYTSLVERETPFYDLSAHAIAFDLDYNSEQGEVDVVKSSIVGGALKLACEGNGHYRFSLMFADGASLWLNGSFHIIVLPMESLTSLRLFLIGYFYDVVSSGECMCHRYDEVGIDRTFYYAEEGDGDVNTREKSQDTGITHFPDWTGCINKMVETGPLESWRRASADIPF